MWWYYNSADIIVVPLILILIWVILKTQNRRYDYCSVNNLNIYIHALLQQFSWYISKQQIHSSSYVLVVHRGILQYFMHDYSICSLHLHKHQLQIAFKIVESSSTLKPSCKTCQLCHWPAAHEVSDCPILWSARRIWPDFSLDLFSLGLEYILYNVKEVF